MTIYENDVIGKCGQCKRKIPEEFLSPLITSNGISKSVCGICALVLRNKVLGTNDKKFRGEMAEEMRKEALDYYKQTKQK